MSWIDLKAVGFCCWFGREKWNPFVIAGRHKSRTYVNLTWVDLHRNGILCASRERRQNVANYSPRWQIRILPGQGASVLNNRHFSATVFQMYSLFPCRFTYKTFCNQIHFVSKERWKTAILVWEMVIYLFLPERSLWISAIPEHFRVRPLNNRLFQSESTVEVKSCATLKHW